MSKEELNIKSSFELAASKLGFDGNTKGSLYITPEEEQEALLKIFYYAGYLEPSQIWQDLNNMGGVDNLHAAFEQIYEALLQSNALQKDSKNLMQSFYARVYLVVIWMSRTLWIFYYIWRSMRLDANQDKSVIV